jgi:hypothetical protein
MNAEAVRTSSLIFNMEFIISHLFLTQLLCAVYHLCLVNHLSLSLYGITDST